MGRIRQSTVSPLVAAILVAGSGGPTDAAAADRTDPLAVQAGLTTEMEGDRGAASGSVDAVRLPGRWFEAPVRRAVAGAARRLAEPACAAVLGEFRDGSGRSLRDRLGTLGLEAPDYARLVLFYDGSTEEPCRRPRIFAFTSPGSRVVRACPSLGALAVRRPDEAEAVVIHEVLHSLGLARDSPSSDAITAAVERRCER
jgi:hypothetical protein